MKKTLIVPVLLLATTPFVVSCTKKPTDLPPPPVVTGTTETVAPVVTPVAPTTQTGTPVQAVTPVAPVVLTRTETVTYASPAGPQDPVEFSVTVTDGVITAASATAKSDNDISKQLQTAFAGELSTKVVGKKAADLDVDAIGGASLTTAAFETFARSF
jgi:FMN-binding domain